MGGWFGAKRRRGVRGSGTQIARRFLADGAVGVALFLLLTGVLWTHGGAQAQALSADIVTFDPGSAALSQQFLAQVPLSGEPSYISWLPSNIFRRTEPSVAAVLLGLVFSVLTALNIGFWRHLMHAYAPQRHDRGGNG